MELKASIKTKQAATMPADSSNEVSGLLSTQNNPNRILLGNSRRQVFSTHQNRDLVSLSNNEVYRAMAGRPPRNDQGTKRKKSSDMNNRKK